MGRFMRMLLAAVLIVPFLAVSAAAYHERVEVNQQRAYYYILELKDGRMDTVERPVMQRARTWKAKKTRRQLIKGMNQAEELARRGQNDRIPDPVWIFEGKSWEASPRY